MNSNKGGKRSIFTIAFGIGHLKQAFKMLYHTIGIVPNFQKTTSHTQSPKNKLINFQNLSAVGPVAENAMPLAV